MLHGFLTKVKPGYRCCVNSLCLSSFANYSTIVHVDVCTCGIKYSGKKIGNLAFFHEFL